jgi:hypothetical protein
MQGEIDALIAKHGTVPPPWAVAHEHPSNMCWRMGGGESHMMLWSEWWPQQNLTEAQKIEYFRRWSPPHCWLAFVMEAIWDVDDYEDDETLAPFFDRLEALGFGSRQDYVSDFHDSKWLATEPVTLMEDVSLQALSKQIARLNEKLRPIAERPVDTSDPNWSRALQNAPDPLDEAGVRTDAEAVLESLLRAYAMASASARASIREIVAENRAFAWATGVPEPPTTAQAFRQHLLWLSAIDQSQDFRDSLLGLKDLCDQARAAGVSIAPVLKEVAALSSDIDETSMGSMRSILQRLA